MLVAGASSGAAAALLLEVLQPGKLGEGGPEAHAAAGTVGREGAPGCPLDEAVDGEALGEGLSGEEEMDETNQISGLVSRLHGVF